VFAQQSKFGLLVMVELDLVPVVLDVAAFALAAEITLVRLVVVFFVAGTAQLGRALIFLVDVALVALHFPVLAQQGEFGLVVVELGGLPVFFAVAGLALRPQFALVRLIVVLFVAGDAGHLQLVLVQVALVAGHTLQWRRLVFAQQAEFGVFGVIEQDFRPPLVDVAGLALLAEVALVRLFVILLVARDADLGRIAELDAGLVAAVAFDLVTHDVFALQLEIGQLVIELVMLERGRLELAPLVFAMACLAFLGAVNAPVMAGFVRNILADLLVAVAAQL